MTRASLYWISIPLALLICLLVALLFSFLTYQPDRRIAVIEPGSSADPTFAVQVIRPRVGLPLGGFIPPRLFGLESHLGFDSSSPGASTEQIGPRRIELSADGWELLLDLDAEGFARHTEITFSLTFQEALLEVRCRPGQPTKGQLSTSRLFEDQISGQFEIGLGECESTETGNPLGWPSQPLTLYGSFDRIPLARAD